MIVAAAPQPRSRRAAFTAVYVILAGGGFAAAFLAEHSSARSVPAWTAPLPASVNPAPIQRLVQLPPVRSLPAFKPPPHARTPVYQAPRVQTRTTEPVANQ